MQIDKAHNKEKIINISLLAFATSLLVASFVLEKVYDISFSWDMFSSPSFYSSISFLSFILYVIGYIPLLIKSVFSFISEAKEKNYINEHLLMIVATLGAFFICEFKESIFVLDFAIVGEMIEDYAVNRSKRSIASLVNDMPLYAHLVRDDKIVESKPEELKVGDIIEIKMGEKVPVDGRVYKGCASLNLASINGESLPVDVKVGDKIISGSIVLNSSIRVVVEKPFVSSTLSKMMKAIQEEQDKKASVEKFITKFAKIYTPVVMFISLAVFLIGFASCSFSFLNGGKEWLYRALSILLISCPCALVIAVPICFFAGIGSASRSGILIKGANAIENIAKSDSFFFDKTGTLTKGSFKLINDVDKDMLQIASSLEDKSTHPLKSAFIERNELPLLDVQDFTLLEGAGIKGKVLDKEYILGSSSLLKDEGDIISSPYKVIYLISEGKVAEHFILADSAKEEARDALVALKREGVKENTMLSGDDEKIVEAVKDEIGLDKAYGNLLPEDKASFIQEEKEKGMKTCFVGDGINDSLSMLKASCSISMGDIGSDAAIESSDVVIADGNLYKVAEAKRLAKKTMSTLYIGIALAILLKVVFMVLVLSGILGRLAMLVSSISDTGVMVICLLNASRMLFYKPKYISKR